MSRSATILIAVFIVLPRLPLFPAVACFQSNRGGLAGSMPPYKRGSSTTETSLADTAGTRLQSPDAYHFNAAMIILTLLATTVASTLVFLICRCLWSIYRTPTRDMTADHLDRYYLERELKEIEARQWKESLVLDNLNMSGHPPPAYENAPSYSPRSKDRSGFAS